MTIIIEDTNGNEIGSFKIKKSISIEDISNLERLSLADEEENGIRIQLEELEKWQSNN